MNKEPSLFSAVVTKAPVFDLIKHSQGASGSRKFPEYGNPNKPKELKFMLENSPYQNVSKNKKYPANFIYTTSSDDRVPAFYGRKMAAKLKSYGNEVYYYEADDGGHSGASTLDQRAFWISLKLNFFRKKLFKSK